MLQVEDGEKFPQALGFENLILFFRIGKQGLCFAAIKEDGSDERLVQLELTCEADVNIAPPGPV